jgi:hypothetical protein
MALVKVPPHARAAFVRRGHRFAAYPRCSADMGMKGGRDAQATRPSTKASWPRADRVHRNLSRRPGPGFAPWPHGIQGCVRHRTTEPTMRLWNASLFSEASGTAPFRAIQGHSGQGSGQVVRGLGFERGRGTGEFGSGSTIPFRPAHPLLGCIRPDNADNGDRRRAKELPNNAMQLTKLRAAPVLRAEVPPCARAARTDAGTASQLIASVRRTGPSRGCRALGWRAVNRLTSYGLTATESGQALAATDRRLRTTVYGSPA